MDKNNLNKSNLGKKYNVSKNNVLILLYIMFTIFGFVMLLHPQILMIRISYSLSIVSIVIGIVFIISYFISNAYLSMDQYTFSTGVLFVILGICAFFRAKELAHSIVTILGIILVISSVLKLQYAVDLKTLKDRIWLIFLALATVIGICAIVILVYPFQNSSTLDSFTYCILIVDGIISIISIFYLSFRLKKYLKHTTPSEFKEDFSSATKESNAKQETT